MGAAKNGFGVVGVAPETSLVAVRIADDEVGTLRTPLLLVNFGTRNKGTSSSKRWQSLVGLYVGASSSAPEPAEPEQRFGKSDACLQGYFYPAATVCAFMHAAAVGLDVTTNS